MITIAPVTPAVNFEFFADDTHEADEYRPTSGPDYIPTPEENAEAAELFNSDDFDIRTDEEWEAMVEEAIARDAVCSGHYAF